MKKSKNGELTQAQIQSVFECLDSGQIQELLWERSKTAALAFGVALLEADAEALCGGRYARKGENLCHRGGSEQTSIIVGGARYAVRRPRVRDGSGEVELPSLSKLRDRDVLDRKMHERMMLGVSTRNYAPVIEGYSKKLGVSKSSVSRAFERVSRAELEAINHDSLEHYSFLALVVDGLEIGGRCVVAALGITAELEKVPLGLKEGDTENAELVKELLSSLQDRQFTLHCESLLAVIDGSKALRKALRQVFGERLLVQRCWLHKVRNINAYLPKSYHSQCHWRMKRLMHLKHLEEARRELGEFRRWLEQISPQAAESLDEAGEELLTLHVLGISGELRKSLSSTNILESIYSGVRTKIERVKNWRSRGTEQILRWVASSVMQHKKKMRRLRGVSQRQLLITALGEKLEVAAA